MKKVFLSLVLLLSALSAVVAQPRRAGYPHYPVRDLGLIYAGASDRPKWTAEELRPYIVHKFANGKTDWLFDGFLFIEYHTWRTPDGLFEFIPMPKTEPAMKKQYVAYLDYLFSKDVSLDALDKEISALKDSIGDPGFKHKIVLTLFVPRDGQTNWGRLNGRALDFNKLADKVEAVSWMLNQLVARFNAAQYKNLELIGMYWPYEELRDQAGEFALQVSQKVHEKGLKFCWIPWYMAPGSDHWWDYGFDMVYQQPNYFVWPKAEKQQLYDACQRARDYNMGVEFEANTKCLSGNTADGNKPEEYVKRFKAYIDAFKKEGVMTHAPMAYYTDTKLLLQFAQNPTKQNRQLADLLAKFIVDRQKIKRLDP